MSSPLKKLSVVSLNKSHATELLSWRYESPYDFYDPPNYETTLVKRLVDKRLRFHAVLNHRTEMLGYCSYGDDGKVDCYDYVDGPLDIGLGMHPDLTGKGLGRAFFSAILLNAIYKHQISEFRVTVASFNRRAICLYEHFGFQINDRFIHPASLEPYVVMAATIHESDLSLASL